MKRLDISDLEGVLEKDIFKTIIQHDVYWNEIFEIIKSYKQYKVDSLNKQMYGSTEIKKLEDFGVDFNYKDKWGNNFLQFMLDKKKHSRDTHFFVSILLEPIIFKTDNIYHLNNHGQHILFNILDINHAGYKGEKLFSLLKKYPDFNLHQIDKSGKNLLHHALLKAQPEIIDFFISKNISLTQIDNNKQSLLHYIPLTPHREYYMDLFNKLINKIDITIKDKHQDSCLTTILDFCTSKNMNDEGRAQAYLWSKHMLSQIFQVNFIHTPKSIDTLIKDLKKYQNSYIKSIPALESNKSQFINAYNDSIASLNYLKLDLLLPEKKSGKAVKI